MQVLIACRLLRFDIYIDVSYRLSMFVCPIQTTWYKSIEVSLVMLGSSTGLKYGIAVVEVIKFREKPA